MTDSASVLLTLAATVIGSGVGTAIVAALFKRRFDTELEIQKALLQRSGKIHERQVDTLLAIHSKMELALFYLQRVTSRGKIKGEDDQKMTQNMAVELASASKMFSENRLLFTPALEQKLDDFFQKMVSAGIDLNVARDPILRGEPSIPIWDSVRQAAYTELPKILDAIRIEARKVIHG